MTPFLSFIIYSLLPFVYTEVCPKDLSVFRSQAVQTSFDPTKLVNFWYEAAYVDVTQAFSTCQTLNTSLNVSTGVFKVDFAVKYGSAPFKILEIYTPTAEKGMYVKTVLPPFEIWKASDIDVPTVIVDVTQGAKNSSYDTLTMYSCVDVGDVKIEEVVFASKYKMLQPDTLGLMIEKAQKLGLQWDPKKLHIVNRTTEKCE